MTSAHTHTHKHTTVAVVSFNEGEKVGQSGRELLLAGRPVSIVRLLSVRARPRDVRQKLSFGPRALLKVEAALIALRPFGCHEEENGEYEHEEHIATVELENAR